MASASSVLILHSLRAELVASDVSCSVPLPGPMVLIRGRVRRPIAVAIFAITDLTMLDNLTRTGSVLFTTGSDDLSSFMSTECTFPMQASGAVLGLVFGFAALAAVTLDVLNTSRDEAVTDGMTQLLNRRGFERATWAAKQGKRRSGSVVACDIDHFKRVNDSFGHAAGDQVIVGFARIVRGLLLPRAVAARVGGEEFAIFLPGYAAAEADPFAERVRAAMAAHDWSGAGIAAR